MIWLRSQAVLVLSVHPRCVQGLFRGVVMHTAAGSFSSALLK